MNWFLMDQDKKKEAVKEMPEETLFYIFSTKWTNPSNPRGKGKKYDEFVKIWWGHNNSGYTYDLNGAGKYTKEQILTGGYFNDSSFPIPVNEVEAGNYGTVMRSVYN